MILVSALVALSSGQIGDPMLAPVRFKGALCSPTGLIVKLAEGAVIPGAKILSRPLRLALVPVPDRNLESAYDRLVKTPGVLRVEPDRVARPAYVPNDPKYPDTWALTKMRVDLAWDRTRGSNQVTVAIMDTGVEATHEDLQGNIWRNPGEIEANGIDDDGNGYIDDTIGWDFNANDSAPNDVHGHGTSCAGIAAGIGDNALGSSGVAPRAKIMCLKAARDDGMFLLSATIPAYMYAADNHAQVLSMSFYSDSLSPAEREAVDYVLSKGCLPIAAAGNDSTVFNYYPAAYDSVLAVAATTTSDAKAGFSNWGSWVDVAAPGTGLFTTKIGNAYSTGFAGTSGACPQVAGVAALIGSAGVGTFNPITVRRAIESTAVPVTHSAYGEFTNWGRVDAKAAIDAITTGVFPERAPRFYWMSPLGGGTNTAAAVRAQSAMRLVAADNRLRRTVTKLSDRLVRFPNTSDAGTLTIFDRNIPVFQAVRPETGMVYPATDAGANGTGAASYGGFAELVNRDKLRLRVVPRSDGTFMEHFTFRNVRSAGPKELVIRRYLTNTVGTKEKVEIYDWASNSLPYGTWTTLRNDTAPTSMTEIRLTIANPSRYVDYEGTCYVRVSTDVAPTGTEMFVDTLFLKG